MKRLCFLALGICCALAAKAQKFEGLALSPPMGWNSWNTFQVNINEQLVRELADSMIASGMAAAGYSYIVLDDGWMAKERDAEGYLLADPVKFPSGMKALADYVHSKGLKFGLYNCAGTQTCAGYPGTRGYEYQDARRYAEWQIDYLKYDWCNTEGINAREAYLTMSKALEKAKRPIVFSLCEWGQNKPWEWAAPIGHLWRTTGDIYNCFDCTKDHGTWSSHGVMQIIDMQKNIRQYAGPGHWNDPDMMEVGNGMSYQEDRAHFSIWCMLAAPLIAGNDLRNMTARTKAILTDREAIAINQDPLGIQAYLYSEQDSIQTWVKVLQGGDLAICFLNRSHGPRSLSHNWAEHAVSDTVAKVEIDFRVKAYRIRDVWNKKELGTSQKPLRLSLESHDVLMLRLSPLSGNKTK